jgi:hypothetical protein
MGNMSNIFKGILYTGLAATVGVVGYIAGKSKHWKGISLTTIGLALILYTPRGCDLLEKYATINGEVAKAKIYGTARKDSLDAILNRDREKDTSRTYVLNAVRSVSQLEQNLKNSYERLLDETEFKYNKILSDTRLSEEEKYDKLLEQNRLESEAKYNKIIERNKSDYASTLKNLKTQNDALVENLALLKDVQKQVSAVEASISSGEFMKLPDIVNKDNFLQKSQPNNDAVLIAKNDTVKNYSSSSTKINASPNNKSVSNASSSRSSIPRTSNSNTHQGVYFQQWQREHGNK